MCRYVLLAVAGFMIFFGVGGLYMMPKLIQQQIEAKLQLKIGTKMYERFTNIPLPLSVKFHLFNITNKDQVLSGLERPKFQEVGPFVYQEWRNRHVVDFEDNNRKIRFRESKRYYSLYNKNQINKMNDQGKPEMLDPSNTNITMLNVPLLAVLTKLAQLEEGTVKRKIAARVTQRLVDDGRDKILVTRPANEILFDGFKVDFMEAARELVDSLGFNFDSPLPGNKFGFFYMKNGTWNKNEAGEMLIFTGRHGSARDYPRVDSWNDKKELNVWYNNTEAKNRCNQIKGTDGSQFHPGVTRQQTLSIFSPLVCTSIFVKYKEDSQVRGIPTLRFITPPEVFAAPRKNPRNACYCTIKQNSALQPTDHTGNPTAAPINDTRCYLDGLLDLSLCQRGAPIAASAPHFYNADPMLALASGLKPDKSIHETYLDIEPLTGSVVKAASRAQINAFVEDAALQVIDSDIVGKMTPMVAPLFWLEESAEVDEKISKELKDRLLSMVQKAHRTCVWSVILGIIIILAVSIQYFYACYYTSNKNLAKEREKSNRKAKDRGQIRSRYSKGAQYSNSERMQNGSDDELGTNSDLNKSVPTEAIAGSMGAVGADIAESDMRRLMDNEEHALIGEESELKDDTKSLTKEAD